MNFGFKFGLLGGGSTDLGMGPDNFCFLMEVSPDPEWAGYDSLAIPPYGSTDTLTVSGGVEFSTAIFSNVTGLFILRFGAVGDEQIYNGATVIEVNNLGATADRNAAWNAIDLRYEFTDLVLAQELHNLYIGSILCGEFNSSVEPENAMVDENGTYLIDENGTYITT